MRYLISLAAWLLVWMLLSALFDLHSMLLPDMKGTLTAAANLLLSQVFLKNMAITFLRFLPGTLLSAAIGVPVGITLASSKLLRTLFGPLLDFLRGVPAAILFPVVIILFGIGETARVVLTLYVSLPILVASALSGSIERPENSGRRQYLALHRGQISPWHQWLCLLWDALPSIFSGLKIALSLSLVVIIISEMFFVGGTGVGWFAWDQYQAFRLDQMYGTILIIGTMSLLLNSTLDFAINRFARRT
jgi:ABC-type nitrate/sulfonate/bicarbonate transport system permease component